MKCIRPTLRAVTRASLANRGISKSATRIKNSNHTNAMKTNRISYLMLAALAAVSLTGCSTTASRIRANPEAFGRLTPEQQSLVKAGHVGLGFDKEAVRLALGNPDSVTTTLTNDGDTTVWHYASYEADGHLLYTGFYHAGRGWWGGPASFYYLDYPNRRVHDRFSVLFRGDRVSSITKDEAG